GVKDGDDLHACLFCSVIDAIGKPRHNRFANVCENERVLPRVRRDSIEDFLDSREKRNSKAGPLLFVVVECLVEFGLGFVAQNDGQSHRRALASARAFTNSQAVTTFGRATLSACLRSSSSRCDCVGVEDSSSSATLSLSACARAIRSST